MMADIDSLMKRFDEVNQYYIEKVARQIREIGELSQSNINRVAIMAEMNENIADINQRLAKAANLAINDLYRIYEDALNDTYTDRRFKRALEETPFTDDQRRKLEHYAQVISIQTAGTMRNLSNTTAVRNDYKHIADNAILAVTSGLGDYKSLTRESVRQLGYNGLQVMYQSGYHRRLDTAIRQNIIDGSNQIAQNSSIMMGEQLGFDAYELSAHAHSAPDHEPVQGRVFLKAEFEKMQSGQPFQDTDGRHYNGFRRPIGEWNCQHIAMSFSTKYSVRRYSDEELAKWAADNKKGCEIDGRHYTIYQAQQLMRKFETQIRRDKDAAVAAKEADDMDLRKELQKEINRMSAKYAQIANISGLTPHRDRMMVNGFRAVKNVKDEKDDGKSEAAPKESGGHKNVPYDVNDPHEVAASKAYREYSRTDDAETIAKNSGLSVADIRQIKRHVFFEKHKLYNGYQYFYPDYDMAVAWKRLQEGRAKQRDIILLKHELLESKLEKEYNLTIADAHERASQKYDWARILDEETDKKGEPDGLL